MTTYRGLDGYLTLGGALKGAGAPPKLKGALIAGASTMVIDGNGSALFGGCVAGDKFTIAGESGSPTHTVSGGPYLIGPTPLYESGPISFTPVIAAGGAADNATVTFQSAAVAQCRSHVVGVDVELLDSTYMGVVGWRQFVGGLAVWRGQGEVLLDGGDARQKELIDDVVANGANSTQEAMLFGVKSTGPKQWYGLVSLTRLGIQSQMGDLVLMSFDFSGIGAVYPDWT